MNKIDIGILSSIGENAEFLHRVQDACDQASKNLAQRASDLGNMTNSTAQGLFAETWHAETFNVDTVLNRMDSVKAQVLNSVKPKSVDVQVSDNGEAVADYGLKYYRDGKASVNAQKGYGDQERLIPTDQMDDAQNYYDRQIPKDKAAGTENRVENARELESMRDKTTDRIKHDRAESEPLGRKDNEEKYKDAKRGEKIEILPQIDAAKIAEESLRSGAVAAGITIGMTVAPRIYNSIAFRCKQGEWPPETLKDIFEGTASAGAEAGLRGAVATSLTMSAKAGLLGEAMRTVDPTIIGTLTYIAFEGVKDFNKYANGKISGEILADSLMGKSVSASAGAYGAVIGQAMIPVPVVGAMIGAMVGSIVAQNGYRFLDVVSESYFRSEQFEEMKEINIALAKQWNAFLNDYENWSKNNKYYQEKKAIFVNRAVVLDTVNEQLDDQLMQALEAGDE